MSYITARVSVFLRTLHHLPLAANVSIVVFSNYSVGSGTKTLLSLRALRNFTRRTKKSARFGSYMEGLSRRSYGGSEGPNTAEKNSAQQNWLRRKNFGPTCSYGYGIGMDSDQSLWAYDGDSMMFL